MKEKYIELMEITLSAYTDGHIREYFDRVKTTGLTEHGFPRLTANIGVLIAHGRRLDLFDLFLEMMEFCCSTIPKVKAANDFSVREIITCLHAVEKSSAVAAEDLARWKGYLAMIDPLACYDVYASSPDDKVKNWALFTGVSEYFRLSAGLGGTMEFIDTQLASQFKWLDENGMYMDNRGDVYHPLVYDAVPRGLFSSLLNEGYRGKHFKTIDDCLRRAGLISLMMQSPTGEFPFGGRSNQFIHNEPWMMGIFEYEANRYYTEGNYELAGKFKAAIARGAKVTEGWLSEHPISHIKNRYPIKTKHGCENYAYFDKYMITVASNLYAAYLMCNDSIPCAEDITDTEPCCFATTYHFHKLFIKAGGYGLEFDLNADPGYDASGLGRVHRVGTPVTVCLSAPCPESPHYTLVTDRPRSLSLCPGILRDGEWIFATGEQAQYSVEDMHTDKASAYARLLTDFGDRKLTSSYKVNADGVEITLSGSGDIAYSLPAFHFDGESYTEITRTENTLCIEYRGYICQYTVSGSIFGGDCACANRNGLYKNYAAFAKDELKIKIDIFKK